MPAINPNVYAWATAVLGLVFPVSLRYLQRDRLLPGKNDFPRLQVGAKLSGEPESYDAVVPVLLIAMLCIAAVFREPATE